MIERRVAAGDIAGAVVAIARKGKVAHVSAHGVMDLESRQPITPAGMFRIASMTKPIVGTAIMMLVEEGKLRLNDPVSRYIPEFRDMKVAVAQPGSAPPAPGAEPSFTTTPAKREITVKDLLTHVSGLGSGPMSSSDIAKVARKDGEKLSDYIPRLGRDGARVPAGIAVVLQPRRRLRNAGPDRRDRVRACRSTSSSAPASSIRWR